MRWPRAAPKTRDGITDSLATVLPVLTTGEPGRPTREQLRTALRQHALMPADKRPEPTPEIAETVAGLSSPACRSRISSRAE